MKDDMQKALKAEKTQAINALLIPFFLFVACVTFAAGVFLLYNSESLGWVFVGITGGLALWSFYSLFKYQNAYRARGIMPDKEDIMVEFSDEIPGRKKLVVEKSTSIADSEDDNSPLENVAK